MLLQELLGKEQEKVAEVSRVRVELQEQIGHLQAERTAQGGLKEKISALEREIKGTIHCLSFRSFCLYFHELLPHKNVCFNHRFVSFLISNRMQKPLVEIPSIRIYFLYCV